MGEAFSVIQTCETSTVPVHIHCDCQRFVHGVNRFPCLTPRQKLRTPYRSIFRHFSRLREAHNDHIELSFVRAHTDHNDPHSIGNRIANSHARNARSLPQLTTPNLLIGEERYVIYDRDELVVNDYRRHLTGISRSDQFSTWTDSKWQGHVARQVTPTYHFPKNLCTFSINLLTRTLPMGRLIQHTHNTSKLCPFCSLDILDDIRHFFTCPATTPSVWNLKRDTSTQQRYGQSTSILEYARTHLTDYPRKFSTSFGQSLQDLFLITSHRNSQPISPFTFRMCTNQIPTLPRQPPTIFALSIELQRTFGCTYQICSSPQDILPLTYRWNSYPSHSPEELGGFDYITTTCFSGCVICSFPLDPRTHNPLFTRFLRDVLSTEPFRVVFFMTANTPIPTQIQPYHIPGDRTPYNFFVIQNRPARKLFHVDLKLYFSRFQSHYPISKSILPPPKTPTKFLTSLDQLSDLFWLPEIGLRLTIPPAMDMILHDPAMYLLEPFEMRLLGLTRPNSPLNFTHNKFFQNNAFNIKKHFLSIYQRRTRLWGKFCSLIKSHRENDD